MRAWLWLLLVVSEVHADKLRLRRLAEEPPEPWLHLDAKPIDLEPRSRWLSYDLGPFRIAAGTSQTDVAGSSHRMIGLFAYRTFRLSRWMHAWISLGISFDQWVDAAVPGAHQGLTMGLTLGTTFR